MRSAPFTAANPLLISPIFKRCDHLLRVVMNDSESVAKAS